MVCGIFTRAACCYVLWFLSYLAGTAVDSDTVGKMRGDVVLGGIFRIRHNNGTNKCGRNVEVEVGIQRVEAMVYAIEMVNKDPDLLPNLTLGAEIRDSCGLGTMALDEALKFILDSVSLRANSRTRDSCAGNVSKDVVGVVGASRSSFSIEVANLLRLFRVPQVSYASTSAELSDSDKYSYFARTVPPDTLQALAMLHVVREFHWESVFTVNSAGSYGEKGIEQFKNQASNASVCVVLSRQVNDKSADEDYDKIIDKFATFSPTTRVVVLFMKDNHVKKLLQSAKRKNYRKVAWIASDEWGTRADVVTNLGDYFEHADAITVTLPSPPLENFTAYFRNLTRTAVRDRVNPWFKWYWEQNCNSSCNTTKFNDKLLYVINAVYVFAHALDEMYKELCPSLTGICPQMKPVNGTELRDRILKVRFKGIANDDVAFDENGDSKGKYHLFHYAGSTSNRYTLLGEWQTVLNLTGDTTNLRTLNSTCSENCNLWSRSIQKEETSCCFRCFDCPHKERQYVNAQDVTCVNCEEDQRPNATYNGCEDLPLRYIPKEWVVVVSIFSGFGVLCTLIVIGLFIHNVNTPLVKASGRDLMFPLLAGVMLNYIITFFLVSKPSVVVCAIQRFGYGFSASICYASILIKTNRIARIFSNRNLKSVGLIKPHTQLVILFLLIGIEVSLVSVGLMMKPPRTIKVLPTAQDILAKCNFTKLDYAISLPYNLLLVILCTIYSFRTRKMPSSFNEAKYLGFVMYTTCIIWIAFLPVYYGTAENYQPIALSLNTTLNATTILVCVFGPKLYILVLRPARNIQTTTSTTISHYSTAETISTTAGHFNTIKSTSKQATDIQESNSSESTTRDNVGQSTGGKEARA